MSSNDPYQHQNFCDYVKTNKKPSKFIRLIRALLNIKKPKKS